MKKSATFLVSELSIVLFFGCNGFEEWDSGFDTIRYTVLPEYRNTAGVFEKITKQDDGSMDCYECNDLQVDNSVHIVHSKANFCYFPIHSVGDAGNELGNNAIKSAVILKLADIIEELDLPVQSSYNIKVKYWSSANTCYARPVLRIINANGQEYAKIEQPGCSVAPTDAEATISNIADPDAVYIMSESGDWGCGWSIKFE